MRKYLKGVGGACFKKKKKNSEGKKNIQADRIANGKAINRECPWLVAGTILRARSTAGPKEIKILDFMELLF